MSATNITSKCKIASIAPDDAMILPHDANLRRMKFSERTGAPHRLKLRASDRALLVWMTRLWPSLLGAAKVVQPETILRWHRSGFKAFWRWKSRKRAGRPKIDRGLRDLIQRMSKKTSSGVRPGSMANS
jgi:hypothetical protein